MKKTFLYSLISTYFILIIIFLFSTIASAEGWYELNSMSDSELIAKVDEFKKKLDQEPDNDEILKTLGIAYLIMAIKNPQAYAPLAVKFLSNAYERNENDYAILCYLGSATTLMATTTNDTSKMGSYTNQGIALMDKAVRKAPDNITVRLTRAYHSKNLPDFLGRRSVAIEDFEYLAEMIKNESSFPVPLKKEIYLNLIELYEKSGNTEKAEYCQKLANGL